MLHVHSYNMGVTAGLAWKHAGKGLPDWGGKLEDDAEKFILEILEISDKDNYMFLPSSFMEGFTTAWSTKPYLITS